MNLLRKLWNDDAGVLLSAEAAVVGTVAAAGITAGATTLATSVNEELKELAFSLRSLDQSYCIPAQEGCHACVAGSSFTQDPVEDSLAALREVADAAQAQQDKDAASVEESEAAKPQAAERKAKNAKQNKKKPARNRKPRKKPAGE
ncbi:MAG: hypothetical protein R3C19_26295 [Planctomycetaceae bacterium]